MKIKLLRRLRRRFDITRLKFLAGPTAIVIYDKKRTACRVFPDNMQAIEYMLERYYGAYTAFGYMERTIQRAEVNLIYALQKRDERNNENKTS